MFKISSKIDAKVRIKKVGSEESGCEKRQRASGQEEEVRENRVRRKGIFEDLKKGEGST